MKTFAASVVALLSGMVCFAGSNTPTFDKDVLPILQKNCQECHRPGEVAPMSLLTYKEARPWARAIKSAVLNQKMPPWFADPQYGHFSNERRLSEADIHTLVSWVDNDAPEGNPTDMPPPRTFQDGWNIKPDVVVELPHAFPIPATGTINYQYIVVKTNFPEDMWVTAAEMRPSNAKVLHHGKVYVRPPGSHWMENCIPGKPYETGMGHGGIEEGNDIIGKYNPGLGAQNFDFDGSAKFIPKGSDVVFELHYTSIGVATSDLPKVGFVLAKHPPTSRYYTSPGSPAALNMLIKAGDENAEVVSEVTTAAPSKLIYIQPHMHLRGKDYELMLVYPTGEKQIAFKGKFDFNWQLGYDLSKPLVLPTGTRIIGIAHYDNSANNRFNPDPTKDIRWGPQNWDEMQSVFLGFILDLHENPAKLLKFTGPSLLPRAAKYGPTMADLSLLSK